MTKLFLAIHYPRPEHVDDLVGAMAVLGEALACTPGVLSVSTWRDETRVVAMSVWESSAALVAAQPAMAAAIANVPFDVWEERPRERYLLDELAIPRAAET